MEVSRHVAIAGEGFDDLLRGPLVGGMLRDVDVDALAPVVGEDDEAVRNGIVATRLNTERKVDGASRLISPSMRPLGWLAWSCAIYVAYSRSRSGIQPASPIARW